MKLIILGAGKIGRGFLAQLFCSAKWTLVFVDNSSEVIEMLHRRPSYPVYLAASNGNMERFTVKGYEALHTSQADKIQKELRSSDVAAMSVPAADFEQAFKVLYPGLLKRLERTSPFNLVVCANKAGAAEKIRAIFFKTAKDLGLESKKLRELNGRFGIVDTIVIRMAPQTPPELLQENPLAVLTNDYPELFVNREAYIGALPDVPGLTAVEHFHSQEVRKLYTYNTVHAVFGFLGLVKGHSTVMDCLNDPWIRAAAEEALSESSDGLIGEYGFTEDQMCNWNKRLLEDMENPYLGDQLERLVMNTEEKLSRNDRLVGPALLALKHRRKPKSLSLAIASALCTLKVGAEKVYELCGLTARDRELVKEITQAYIWLEKEHPTFGPSF